MRSRVQNSFTYNNLYLAQNYALTPRKANHELL